MPCDVVVDVVIPRDVVVDVVIDVVVDVVVDVVIDVIVDVVVDVVVVPRDVVVDEVVVRQLHDWGRLWLGARLLRRRPREAATRPERRPVGSAGTTVGCRVALVPLWGERWRLIY